MKYLSILLCLSTAAYSDFVDDSIFKDTERVCACRCQSLIGQLCPVAVDEKTGCLDLDFEFDALTEPQCHELDATACKGYPIKATQTKIRGRFESCALVGRIKQ